MDGMAYAWIYRDQLAFAVSLKLLFEQTHFFFRFLCYVIFKELLPDINTDMSNMFCSVLHQITENIQRLKYANSVCGVSSNGLRCTK